MSKIRIVKKNDEFSMEYKVGDIFEVDSTWYGGANVTSITGIPLSLDKDEYELLDEEMSKTAQNALENGRQLKVLMLNGSANLRGCTYTALEEVGKTLTTEGIDYEIFQTGADPIRDCIGCKQCTETGCIFDDDRVNAFVAKAKEADGFVFGTPVYYAHPSGRVLSFLDRAFYSSKEVFAYKPAAAVASARRGGTTASLDVLNKYFGISQMPTVGSTYWNMVHGNKPEEVCQDKEGLQTMRNIGHNMAWMLKCFELGREHGAAMPRSEGGNRTNFIR